MKRRYDLDAPKTLPVGRMKRLELVAETVREEEKLARFYLELRKFGQATLIDETVMNPIARERKHGKQRRGN
jgi:hypothetical protein